MATVPFNQRLGLIQSKPIDDNVPEDTRVALVHFVVDLYGRKYLKGTDNYPRGEKLVLRELHRCGRFTGEEFEYFQNSPSLFDLIITPLKAMKWWQVYTFFERVYERLLTDVGYQDDYEWVEEVSLSEVRRYYTDEINTILAEENIAYHFVNGQFQRRGRAQTQKSIQRVGKVLGAPQLSRVRDHYNKARKFFNERPEPDVKNCIKESLCALEACLGILTGEDASGNFKRVVTQIQGNEQDKIPSPLAQGMIKLHGYRGSGKGVAHAALEGNPVTELEAELVLNLVASYITYLVDLLQQPEEEIPF